MTDHYTDLLKIRIKTNSHPSECLNGTRRGSTKFYVNRMRLIERRIEMSINRETRKAASLTERTADLICEMIFDDFYRICEQIEKWGIINEINNRLAGKISTGFAGSMSNSFSLRAGESSGSKIVELEKSSFCAASYLFPSETVCYSTAGRARSEFTEKELRSLRQKRYMPVIGHFPCSLTAVKRRSLFRLSESIGTFNGKKHESKLESVLESKSENSIYTQRFRYSEL